MSGKVEQAPIAARVAAMLSLPRLAFTDSLFSVMTLQSMNIPVRRYSGVFWEQGLTRMMEKAIDEGFDYLLTVDYDTIFKDLDVWHLLQLMVRHPEIDALFPVQYRREQNQLLVGCNSTGQASPADFQGQLLPATSGHFGLTMIRAAALRKIPQPWLWSQPGPDGRWDSPDRVDADIYFWNKLREYGCQVACASRIVIGHMQNIVTWPGDDLQPVHQYLSDYHDAGDGPAEAFARRDAAVAGHSTQRESDHGEEIHRSDTGT